MKKIIAFIAIPVVVASVWIGCAGTPTKLESKLFTISTNYVTVTNELVTTNPDGTKITNLIPVAIPGYVYNKGPGETQITTIGGEVGGLFGVGGLVTTAMGALFGIWRWVRGNKSAQTADALAQDIEMIREFVKQLPNGSTYDSVLTSWIQAHQAEAGVLNQVILILKNEVSNPEAKATADQVTATIAGLLAKK